MDPTAAQRLPSRHYGTRRWVILGGIVAVFICSWWLELKPQGLLPPDASRWDRTGRFFAAALSPALDYQDELTPDDAPPILLKALHGAGLTLRYAAAAMSLAVPVGLVLGFLGSRSWWPQPRPPLSSLLLGFLFTASRSLMTLTRSIHELIWALLFLSAFGVSPLAGMIALAMPFSGTLGKVFSELIDEEALDSARALRAIGHRPVQIFLIGILPRALPNLITYTAYRFECALRSSAVLGFVGIETIGLYIELSHEEFYYREVWTYLYVLLAMIIIADLWGAAIRRRLHT